MALAADCISRIGLRTLAVATLKAAETLAGVRVYDPNTLPQTIDDLPTIVVSTQSERKDTSGEGAPQFNTTIMLAVMTRVARPTTQQAEAEAALDLLIEQVQRAILCTPSMVAPIQRFNTVESHAVLDSSSEQIVGEGTIIFGCEVPQLYEPDAGEVWTETVVSTAKPPRQGPTFRSVHPTFP